nr:hypothetical protein [uncultured Massilia sp.]
MSEDIMLGRVAFLCSVDAFVAGLLFILSLLLALLEKPSDFIEVLTDISVHFYQNSRALGLSGAATMLVVATWRSWRIYQSKVITGPMQLGLGLLACALVLFKFFLFASRLDLTGAVLSL